MSWRDYGNCCAGVYCGCGPWFSCMLWVCTCFLGLAGCGQSFCSLGSPGEIWRAIALINDRQFLELSSRFSVFINHVCGAAMNFLLNRRNFSFCPVIVCNKDQSVHYAKLMRDILGSCAGLSDGVSANCPWRCCLMHVIWSLGINLLVLINDGISNQECTYDVDSGHLELRFWSTHHLLRTWDSWLAAEAKEQVVAHLANFAYDPFNFEHLRTVFSSIPGFHKILENCSIGGTDRFSWRGSPFYLQCDFPALTAACSGSIPGLLDRAQREASWICIRWDM